MLTTAQKKTIYDSVKTSYTISSLNFTASKIYANQINTPVFPVIVLNFVDEEIKDQNSVGNYLGTPGSEGQRSLAMLSINILAKKAQGLNESVIAKDIARQLSIDIRKNWKSLTGGIQFRRKSQTRDLTHIETAQNVGQTPADVSRQQFDVFISYDITW